MYLQTRCEPSRGIAFIDATSLAVCHNRRIPQHRVFRGIAQRGKTILGWFYGFKLHLEINDTGGLVSFMVSRVIGMIANPLNSSLKTSSAYGLGIKAISPNPFSTPSLLGVSNLFLRCGGI